MQFVMNDLGGGYNYGPSNPIDKVYYWDATGSPTIIPKANAPQISRPNGSNDGIWALKNNRSIDFAGSTRGPKWLSNPVDPTRDDVDPVTGLPLLFVRTAQDTLQYALSQATPTNGSTTLSWSQLAQIYTTPGITWNQVDSSNPSTAVIQPMIPQTGSGTRTFFLGSIGITEAQLRTDTKVVQQNDYTPIQNNPDAIAPFSLARYRVLASPKPIQLDNPYPAAGYSAVRFVYNVVRNAGTNVAPVVPANMQAFLGNNDLTGYICGTAGSSIIAQDGFDVLSPIDCGAIDHS